MLPPQCDAASNQSVSKMSIQACAHALHTEGLPAPRVSAVKTAMSAPSVPVSVQVAGASGGTKQPMSVQHCWPAFSSSASSIA